MNRINSQSKMNIGAKHYIFVIDAFSKGGAQRNLELVLPELIILGAQVELVLIQDTTEELSLKSLLASGVQIHRVGARNMCDFSAFFRFFKLVRKRNSSVVANLFWSQIWSALLIVPWHFQKLYWVEHNTYLNRTNLHWILYNFLSRKTTSILAVSLEISEFLQSRFKLNVQLVNNSAKCFYPREKSMNGGFRFLFVGRLVKQKNPILALKAFKYALDNGTIPEQSNLIIIGDGPLKNEMEVYVSTNHLEEKIKFVGFLERDEVSKIMSVSQTLLMTSHYEGSPLVRLEALTHGMTIVTTRTAGINGILTQEETENLIVGVFISDSNIKCLANNMSLASNPTFWTTSAVEARLHAAEKFSPSNVAKTYFQLT